MKLFYDWFGSILILVVPVWVLFGAGTEFYAIASGTGDWLGQLSRTWSFLFFGFVLFSVFIVFLSGLSIWKPGSLSSILERTILFRERLGLWRWILVLVLLVGPAFFFQYTSWGFVFQKFYLRLLTWLVMLFLLSVLGMQGQGLLGWKSFLASLVLTISVFSITASLQPVTDHPFSLGWSEGNRLWDYSILFGRERYEYPAGQRIPVLLEFGRQLIGAIPYLFSNLTIGIERLWVSLTQILPYIFLGFTAFRFEKRNLKLWLLLALWTFLFLQQGPINPSLLLIAIVVALAWRTPLQWAGPLVLFASLYAALSRFTWLFAPGIWIVMLEFGSASLIDRASTGWAWRRFLILGILGILGGLIFPQLIPIILPGLTTVIPAASGQDSTGPSSALGLLNLISQQLSDQPLLWYRLWPNSTYGHGILLALFFAIAPAVAVLGYLMIRKHWQLSGLQRLSLILPLFAFLGVGVVVSTKIGGGGDLHNMDMFLIGLFFCVVIAWKNGGSEWFQAIDEIPLGMKLVLLILLAISPLTPLMEMRPINIADDASRLTMLTDLPDKASLGMLPDMKSVDHALEVTRAEVDKFKLQGEILFIDQRQLLTFGYIRDVPLVAEYEKKVLMNNALSSNRLYFDEFYRDLAQHRFSLIVTQPLNTPVQDSSFQFGEENNAWVKWVSRPVLCYYEPLRLPWQSREKMREVGIQLLVPKAEPVDCSTAAP